MANVFCNDGGSNTSPYDDWAKAATLFLTAVDFASSGDDIIIGADHAEDPAASVTYTFPGTAASINRVISSTVGAGSTIVYNKADNVQVDNGGATNRSITIVGFVHFFGVSFKVGNDLVIQSSPQRVLFNDSLLTFQNTASSLITNSTSGENSLVLENTDLTFVAGGANARIICQGFTKFYWRGGILSYTGTMPTALFDGAIRDSIMEISGVVLSDITSAIFDVSDGVDIIGRLHHCLLNSGVSLTTGTIFGQGTTILMSGCDDTTGNNLYRLEYVDYWGSTVHDDAIFLNASDGTTPISWKMVSTANAVEFSEPTKSPPIFAWVDSTGSKTFTIQCLWDSVTDIQDDEIWLEIEFLEASADTDSAFADDRMADISATPADQTTNAEVWTETLTNDNEFEVAVTVTVNRVGPVVARVHLAKPSTTVYVDPLIVIT